MTVEIVKLTDLHESLEFLKGLHEGAALDLEVTLEQIGFSTAYGFDDKVDFVFTNDSAVTHVPYEPNTYCVILNDIFIIVLNLDSNEWVLKRFNRT